MQTKPKNPKVITTAILTAKDYSDLSVVKVGAILEAEDGNEFILLNHLLDFKRFITPTRLDTGFIKLSIVNKGPYADE